MVHNLVPIRSILQIGYEVKSRDTYEVKSKDTYIPVDPINPISTLLNDPSISKDPAVAYSFS